MTALATAWLDPGNRPASLFRQLDPTALRNSAEFRDPVLFLRWVLLSGQPSLQRATRTDPGAVAMPNAGTSVSAWSYAPGAARSGVRLRY